MMEAVLIQIVLINWGPDLEKF